MITSIVSAFLNAIRPLKDSMESPDRFSKFLADYGWDANLHQIEDVRKYFFYSDLDQIITAYNATQSGPSPSASAYLEILDSMLKVIDGIRNLAVNPSPPVNLFPFDTDNFWNEFPLDLVQGLLFDFIRKEKPLLFSVLRAFGILDSERIGSQN